MMEFSYKRWKLLFHTLKAARFIHTLFEQYKFVSSTESSATHLSFVEKACAFMGGRLGCFINLLSTLLELFQNSFHSSLNLSIWMLNQNCLCVLVFFCFTSFQIFTGIMPLVLRKLLCARKVVFITAFCNEWRMQDISKQDFWIKNFYKHRMRKLIKPQYLPIARSVHEDLCNTMHCHYLAIIGL